ncbi:MASE1 domain-containing protein [Xanthomonas campestris pv. phormiicola]|nr:MASE1 domain-containing protein [Xanthomonas campestris pv. phormiicola]UYC16899.1 MASE1 domain-containing protein [Xanthomonas campestris pv. phormiicola]
MAAGKDIAKGALLSVGYCVAFLLAWRCSVDQWYLPAGLRAASLLFLPARRWPWLLAGDAAALLVLRVPRVEDWGASTTWAYLSPFLLMPAVSLLPVTARFHIPDLTRKDHWLLPLALVTALWSTLCNMALNAALGGPSGPAPIDTLIRYWLGDYLGTLMFVLPALLWVRRDEAVRRPSPLLHEGLASVAVVALLFVAITLIGDTVLRQFLRVLLVVPAIALTLRHGWRGAALGVVLANVAVALSLPKTVEAGVHDPLAFAVQILLAVTATGLFAFGSRISAAYRQVRDFGRVREQALEFAQAGYLSAERTLRKRVVDYTDLTVQINRMRRDVVEYLRSQGHHAAAMQMTRTGVIQAQLLDEYVTALYPLGIETHGLYHTLRSVSFANLCNTEFRWRMCGDPRKLSLGLQLVAYRCVLNAVETLPVARTHLIQARVWRVRGMQGIVVRITADASVLNAVRREHPESDRELSVRLKTHGGTCRRRHALALSFLVSERVGVGINLAK